MQKDYTATSAASNISRSIADYSDGLPPALRGVGSVAVSSIISQGINGPGSPSLADGSRGLFSVENCVVPVASEGVALDETAPPSSNTGVLYTKTLIDWLSFTFPVYVTVADVLAFLMPENVWRADAEEYTARSAWVPMDRGANGYRGHFQRGNISVYHDGAANMGVNVQISGKGCRQLEQEQCLHDEASWVSWFRSVHEMGAKFRRCDVAMDDAGEGCGWNMDTIHQAVRDGTVISLFEKTSVNEEAELKRRDKSDAPNKKTGDTRYFGNRKKSDSFVRFYNKGMEQALPADFHWVRCELVTKKDNADALVKGIILGGLEYVAEVMLHYIDFKQISETDTNMSRWPTAPWWVGFLDTVKKRSLGVAPAVASLEKGAAWIRQQAAITLSLMYEAAGGVVLEAADGSLDWLMSIMVEGRRRQRPHHRAMLAAHRAAFGGGGGSSGESDGGFVSGQGGLFQWGV